MLKVVLLAVVLLGVSCSSASIQAVGPEIVFHSNRAVEPRERGGRLLAVSWNVHVGHGNIADLVRALSASERENGFGPPEFVLLLQEAFRRSDSMPSPRGTASPRRISPPKDALDVQQVARQFGWWLYYSPSMRNGDAVGSAAEDRGNAILSSLPLDDLRAVELPHVVQRRVTVMATVTDVHKKPLIRVAVAHLDTRAPMVKGWIFGGFSARNRQAKGMVESLDHYDGDAAPLVVGGDFNSLIGASEPAVKTVSQFVARQRCGEGATHTSGLVLDHIFARLPERAAPSCRSLDDSFGSDHYPLVLSLSL